VRDADDVGDRLEATHDDLELQRLVVDRLAHRPSRLLMGSTSPIGIRAGDHEFGLDLILAGLERTAYR
jgi:hypothetical protein